MCPVVTKNPLSEGRTGLTLLLFLPLLVVISFLIVPDAARMVLGLVLVLFIPGFAMVYALFQDDEIDDIERIALSFGLSICIVVFDGLALNYIWNLTLLPIVLSLSLISGVFTLIGYLRRRT